MLLKLPLLLLRLPPGRPNAIVTTIILATQYHFITYGLYACSGLPDLIGSLLFVVTFRTLTRNYEKAFCQPVSCLDTFSTDVLICTNCFILICCISFIKRINKRITSMRSRASCNTSFLSRLTFALYIKVSN